MKVYHFTETKWGLWDIKNKKIKISRIEDLNDPFELLSLELRQKKHRQQFQEWKSQFDNQYGVICFSESWSNPVMWSHYADKHRGICLEFIVPDALLLSITYNPNRLPSDLIDAMDLDGSQQEKAMREILTTKFEHWKYERERRIFVRLDQRDSNGHYYKEFDHELELIGVILGPRSDLSKTELRKAFETGGYESAPSAFKSRLAFKSFSVVKNKNEKMWK